MRAVLAIVLVLVVPAMVPAGAAGDAADHAVRHPDLMLPMGDSTRLAVATWTPDGAFDLRPTVILIHGWGGSKSTYDDIAPILAGDGFNVVAYDTRGFGASEGRATVAGPREIADLKQVITWTIDAGLAEPRGIAVGGVSYGGAHAWQIAAEDARVKTVIPIVGWTNLSNGLAPSGVVKLSYGLALYGTGYRPESAPAGNYDDRVHEWLVELATGVNADNAHRDLWARSVDTRIDAINANDISVFAIQGWNDHLFPADQVTSIWDQLTVKKKLGLGGVGHPPAISDLDSPEALYWLGQLRKWLAQEFLGTVTDVGTGAYEIASAPFNGSTLNLTALPTGDLSFKGTFFGQLVTGPTTPSVTNPLVKVLANTFVAGAADDPVLPSLEAEARGAFPGPAPGASPSASLPRSTAVDSHTFTSSPVEAAVEAAGPVTVRLPEVLAMAPYTQLIVRVYMVDPFDVERLVDVGVSRTGPESSGVTAERVITTWGHRTTYEEGVRIRVRISAEDFPAFLPERGHGSSAIMFRDQALPQIQFTTLTNPAAGHRVATEPPVIDGVPSS